MSTKVLISFLIQTVQYDNANNFVYNLVTVRNKA